VDFVIVELLAFLGVLGIFISVTYLAALFRAIGLGMVNGGIGIFASVIGGYLLVSSVLRRYSKNIYNIMTFACTSMLLILLLLSVLVNTYTVFHVIVSIIFIVFSLVFTYGWNTIISSYREEPRVIVILRYMRLIFWSVTLCAWYWNSSVEMINWGIRTWAIICTIEFIIVTIQGYHYISKITVYLKGYEEDTNLVLECSNERIMYRNAEGELAYIDKDDIFVIKMISDYPEPVRKKQKELKVCSLIDGSEKQYQDFKILCENWMCFCYLKDKKYIEEIFQTKELPKDVHLKE